MKNIVLFIFYSVAVFIFGYVAGENHKGKFEDLEKEIARNYEEEIEKKDSVKRENIRNTTPSKERESANNYLELIANLKKENSRLKEALLSQVPFEDLKSDTHTKEVSTLSMDGLSKRAREHALSLMRSRVIELPDSQFDSFDQRFYKAQINTEWSSHYQLSLQEFILKNNQDGLHSIQELGCNGQLCKIEVISDDLKGWNSILSEMRTQDWYSSLMFKKKSETQSGSIVYYLPQRS